MAVNVGDQAPKFELVDGDLKFRSLDEFKGKQMSLNNKTSYRLITFDIVVSSK